MNAEGPASDLGNGGSRPADDEDRPGGGSSPLARSSSLGTVAILGCGLIGGSIGMALRAAGAAEQVVGWNRSPAVLPQAQELGAIDRSASSAAEAVAQADVVVIGVTVEATLPLLTAIVPHLKPGAVVTDVGSAKARIAREGADVLPDRFVGSHPMAGSERTGVGAASADLLLGAPWVLTPVPVTAVPTVERVEALARAVGAVPRVSDAHVHDRMVAALSHLPHILAFGLAQAAGERVTDEWVGLAAGSFRDGTRVAASDPAMWAGILLDNCEEAAAALENFLAWAGNLDRMLRAGDADGVREALERAREARARFRP